MSFKSSGMTILEQNDGMGRFEHLFIESQDVTAPKKDIRER